MTIQHLLYIPTIFLLGLVFGTMINERAKGTMSNAVIDLNGPFRYQTSVKRLLQTFSIFLIVFVITHMFPIPFGSKVVSQLLGGHEIFDKRPVFSSAEVYECINLFSRAGVIAYKRFTYTIDVLFPASFFAFLWTFASFVSERRKISKYVRNILIGFPFFWFASDLIENVVVFKILDSFPNQSEFLGNYLGLITTLKFGLLTFSIFMPLLMMLFARKNSDSV
ncbi:MAG: hypothetical protein RIE59_12045 [Imperialibacter sp.]